MEGVVFMCDFLISAHPVSEVGRGKRDSDELMNKKRVGEEAEKV